MAYLATTAGWALLAAAWAVGWPIWRRRAAAAWWVGPLSVLAGAAWLVCFERLGLSALPRWPLVWRLEWAVPFAAMVLAWFCMAAVAPRRTLHRPLLVVVVATTLWGAGVHAGPALAAAGWWPLSDDRHDPCAMQTAWWSCGPAAVASLTCRLGQPISEAQAAVLCATWPTFGTFPAAMAAGLNRAGLQATAEWGRPLGTLGTEDTGLAYVRHAARVIHVVAVTEVTPTHLRVLDPTLGDRLVPREDMARQWLGVFVAVRRQAVTGFTTARRTPTGSGTRPATTTAPRGAP